MGERRDPIRPFYHTLKEREISNTRKSEIYAYLREINSISLSLSLSLSLCAWDPPTQHFSPPPFNLSNLTPNHSFPLASHFNFDYFCIKVQLMITTERENLKRKMIFHISHFMRTWEKEKKKKKNLWVVNFGH